MELEEDTRIEKGIELYQNYPNPFNANTEIVYQVQHSGFVRLEIFDIRGSLVKKLIASQQPAGKHWINFNAGELASGVYYYRLKVNNKSITKKLLLLR